VANGRDARPIAGNAVSADNAANGGERPVFFEVVGAVFR